MNLENFESIKRIILELENGNLDIELAISQIKKLSDKEITRYELENYWRSDGLDDFVRIIAMPELKDWKEISDLRALELIKEMIDKINDTALMLRNATALEKRFKKSSGTVMELVFQKGIGSENEILTELKKDTTIKL
ncbi:hypothetical protein SAMN04488096_1222 [Mesonia phycicola]|uniref:Uncharacterized protein n=1 Tax=Mesonia phycicola TaxID=579105 RepID=A0A1M6HTS5_9FLAO|nr:hypothetical protein [Mesonia phycicola]SHJ25591.1 hypothetical protein SAMN04488096_1222 [Mesonia phycicola]